MKKETTISAAPKYTTHIKALACVAIGVLIYFFLPAANGLTPLGVKLLSVFVPTVLSWLIIGGTPWASLLGVTMVVLLGVYDGAMAYQMQWGTALVAMVIPFFMLAAVLEDSGAIEYVVKWLISRKVVHGRPKLFMIIFSLSLIFINIFVHPFVVVVLYFKILKQIAAQIGENEDSGFYTSHGLLIGWISQLADGTLIWLRPWIMSMVAVIAAYGFPNFTVTEYLKLSLAYIAVGTIVLLMIIFLWVRPDLSKLANFDDAAMRASLKANPMSKSAKVTLFAMAVVMIVNLMATMTFLGPVSSYLSALPYAASVTLVVCLLAVIPVEGKPILNIAEAAKRVPWGTVIFLGTIMFFASIFGSETYGISIALQNLLTPVVNSIPISICMAVGVIIACLFTNLASNSVSVIVTGACFVPAMLNIPGIDPARVLAFGACIILASGTAIATRSACGVMALLYTDEHLPWTKKILSYAVTLCVIMMIFCIVVLIPMGTSVLAGCL